MSAEQSTDHLKSFISELELESSKQQGEHIKLNEILSLEEIGGIVGQIREQLISYIHDQQKTNESYEFEDILDTEFLSSPVFVKNLIDLLEDFIEGDDRITGGINRFEIYEQLNRFVRSQLDQENTDEEGSSFKSICFKAYNWKEINGDLETLIKNPVIQSELEKRNLNPNDVTISSLKFATAAGAIHVLLNGGENTLGIGSIMAALILFTLFLASHNFGKKEKNELRVLSTVGFKGIAMVISMLTTQIGISIGSKLIPSIDSLINLIRNVVPALPIAEASGFWYLFIGALAYLSSKQLSQIARRDIAASRQIPAIINEVITSLGIRKDSHDHDLVDDILVAINAPDTAKDLSHTGNIIDLITQIREAIPNYSKEAVDEFAERMIEIYEKQRMVLEDNEAREGLGKIGGITQKVGKGMGQGVGAK